MRKLIKNAIRCKHCGDIIESKSVHNFVQCSCGSCFVDGGLDYIRLGFKTSPDDDFENLCEYIDVPGYNVRYQHKSLAWRIPNEIDLPESLDKIFSRFPQSEYYLEITDENGNIVFDTLSGLVEMELSIMRDLYNKDKEYFKNIKSHEECWDE